MTSNDIKNKNERQFAKYLEERFVPYSYHPKPLIFGDIRYYPDFYLPNRSQYIEIVSGRASFLNNVHKYKTALQNGCNLLILKPDGNEYCTSDYVLNCKTKKTHTYVLRELPEPEWQELQAKLKMDKSFASIFLRTCVKHHKSITEFFFNEGIKQYEKNT